MNLVDTPGTNVILQRQQRLTEEFVPRADLILFILSADRPLSESEVCSLVYYIFYLQLTEAMNLQCFMSITSRYHFSSMSNSGRRKLYLF
jgi:Dynamin family